MLTVTTLATAAVFASAQFNGPAPLAWRWSQPTSVAPGGELVAKGDLIYTAVGGRVYAVDQSTGNQVWRFPAGVPLEGANFRSGVSSSGNLIFAAADNKVVFALDAGTGERKWQFLAPDKVIGSPVQVGNLVAMRLSGGMLMAVNAETGVAVYDKPVKFIDGLMGDLSVYRDKLLVAGQNYTLYLYDVAAKKTTWETKFSQLGADTHPVVVGDTIYINSGDYLTAINGINGRPRWDVSAGEPLAFNPAVSTDGIAVVTRTGKVFTYDLNKRPLLKKPVDLGSAPIADIAVSGGNAVISTSNGSLSLVNLKSGAKVWDFIVRPIVPPAKPDPKNPNYVLAVGRPLLAGDSLVQVVADGSMLCFDRNSGVDKTAPAVEMIFPQAGDQVSGASPLKLFFRTTDESSGVNTGKVTVLVDGTELEHQMNRDGYIIVAFDGKNRRLTDGRKKLTVISEDWMGNRREANYFLTIDNALPAVRLPGGSTSNSGGGFNGDR